MKRAFISKLVIFLGTGQGVTAILWITKLPKQFSVERITEELFQSIFQIVEISKFETIRSQKRQNPKVGFFHISG